MSMTKYVTVDAPEAIFSQYALTVDVNNQSTDALNTCDNCNYAREVTMLDGDHPRIRGEHAVVEHHDVFLGGIIPAYAGSTPRSMRSSP